MRYGIVDTTFAVINMGDIAAEALRGQGVPDEHVVRRTVPGFKDLAAASRQLLDAGCDIVVACGMVGQEPIDKQCAQDASFGLQMVQAFTARHVLEVFVHMDEARDDELVRVTQNRVAEHAVNAFWLLEAPDELRRRAGTGQRQGFEDVGPLRSASKDIFTRNR